MLVLPGNLTLGEALTFRWRWRRVCDLGDKVRCGGFGNAIHQHADEWDSQDNRESESEAEQDTFSVPEPPTFLLGGELDAPEVWFELDTVRVISWVEEHGWTYKFSHQTSGSKVGVKEHDDVLLGKKQAGSKYHGSGFSADMAS